MLDKMLHPNSLKLQTALGGASYSRKVLNFNPTAYWPLWDSSGPNAEDVVGAVDLPYASSGITYNETGIGDGNTAVSFDGNDTYVRLGTSAFDSIFDGDYGSAIIWAKVDAAARWTDASTYRWCWHVRSNTDATYYITMGKTTTNHQIQWRRRSGGVITSVLHTFTPSGPTDWFCMGMTWNIDEPEIRCFLSGQYIGQDGTGFTAWGANSVNDGVTVLFAGSLTLQEWIGSGAHCVFWDSKLPDDVMKTLTKLN